MFQPDTTNNCEPVIALLNKAMQDKRTSQPRRQYLGASTWGEPCDRKLSYGYHQTPIDEDRGFSSEILRVFDMGHDCEDRVAEYLRLAGFELHTHKPDGKQYGFEAAEGKLKGHIDGVITSGPEIPGLKYPCLWENKGLNDKSWNDTSKKGVRLSKPLYYAQANTYCAYLELPNTLFTTMNRNTGEMYAEVIPLDARNAQESSDRAVRVVNSQSPEEFGRIAAESTDFRCKFCDFRRRCWDTPIVKLEPAKTDRPSWLK